MAVKSQLPPPKLENGKQTTETIFGKHKPSTTPRSIEPKAHQAKSDKDTGSGLSASLPRIPIQKQPMPPMNAPLMRSRAIVAGIVAAVLTWGKSNDVSYRFKSLSNPSMASSYSACAKVDMAAST